MNIRDELIATFISKEGFFNEPVEDRELITKSFSAGYSAGLNRAIEIMGSASNMEKLSYEDFLIMMDSIRDEKGWGKDAI